MQAISSPAEVDASLSTIAFLFLIKKGVCVCGGGVLLMLYPATTQEKGRSEESESTSFTRTLAPPFCVDPVDLVIHIFNQRPDFCLLEGFYSYLLLPDTQHQNEQSDF